MQTFKNIYSDFSRLFAVVILLWMVPTAVVSQPSVRMHNIKGCSNTEVIVPIEIVNMQNIAALTLYIEVDTSTVEYIGVEDVNGAFSSGDFVGGENQQVQIINVNWFSTTPASIDSGLMCNIRVLLKKSSCDLLFSDDCEFINPDLSTVENVEYVNGSILALGSYVPDPVTQTVIEGSNVNITLTNVADGLFLNWQKFADDSWVNLENNATFSGVQTAELIMHSVSNDMNETTFRCLVSDNECAEGTFESELYVTPNSVSNMVDQSNLHALEVYPNPANNRLNCKINTDIRNGQIVLVTTKGEIVKRVNLVNAHAGDVVTINIKDNKVKLYLVNLYNKGALVSSEKVFGDF